MDNNPNGIKDQHQPERPLGSAWCLWEKYQEAFPQPATNYAKKLQATAYTQTSASYEKNLRVIYTFDTLEKFALLWKYTTYSKLSELFFDTEKDVTKKFKIDEQDEEEEEKVVDGLFLFRKDVQPKWEDPANQKGCSIAIDIYNLSGEAIDALWKNIMFAVIGENFPFSECVTGFRVLDRLKKHKFIKFELWMSSGVAAYKSGSAEYKQNEEIINAITAYAHKLINRTQEVSIYNIIKKEHSVASKVN